MKWANFQLTPPPSEPGPLADQLQHIGPEYGASFAAPGFTETVQRTTGLQATNRLQKKGSTILAARYRPSASTFHQQQGAGRASPIPAPVRQSAAIARPQCASCWPHCLPPREAPRQQSATAAVCAPDTGRVLPAHCAMYNKLSSPMEVSDANWLRCRRLANALPAVVRVIHSLSPPSTAPKYCSRAMIELSSAATSHATATVRTSWCSESQHPPIAQTNRKRRASSCCDEALHHVRVGARLKGCTHGKATHSARQMSQKMACLQFENWRSAALVRIALGDFGFEFST